MTTLSTAVRILDINTLAVVVELEDPANGLSILDPMQVPEEGERQARIKGARAGGSYGIGESVPDDGSLGLSWQVSGATWGEATGRYLAVKAALRSRKRYLIEVVMSGVTTRYLCDAPALIAELPITTSRRLLNRRVFDVQFTVQPNPTVTIT